MIEEVIGVLQDLEITDGSKRSWYDSENEFRSSYSIFLTNKKLVLVEVCDGFYNWGLMRTFPLFAHLISIPVTNIIARKRTRSILMSDLESLIKNHRDCYVLPMVAISLIEITKPSFLENSLMSIHLTNGKCLYLYIMEKDNLEIYSDLLNMALPHKVKVTI